MGGHPEETPRIHRENMQAQHSKAPVPSWYLNPRPSYSEVRALIIVQQSVPALITVMHFITVSRTQHSQCSCPSSNSQTLPVHLRIEFRNLTLVFKARHGLAPLYLTFLRLTQKSPPPVHSDGAGWAQVPVQAVGRLLISCCHSKTLECPSF